jgi:hypothetical protein
MQVAASALLLMLLLLLLLGFSPTAVAQPRTPITNVNINSAVSDWTTNPTTATTKYGSIGGWNVAAVTDMGDLFKETAFNQNLAGWNTASVSNMGSMFFQAAAFNQNIGRWNTAKVSRMDGMFQSAAAFNQNIAGWNTALVSDMFLMFFSATTFYQNLGAWNTASVSDMRSMLYQAAAFNQNIAGWNTASVSDMSFMFNVQCGGCVRPEHRRLEHGEGQQHDLDVLSGGRVRPEHRRLERPVCDVVVWCAAALVSPASLLRSHAAESATSRVSASSASPEYVFCRAPSDARIRHVPLTELSLDWQAPSPTPSA